MGLTTRQREANKTIASHGHVLLYGGSRSGKTWVIIRAIVARAIKAPKSSHVILRLHFNHLKHSIIYDTFPSVMEAEFPRVPYKLDRSDWFAYLPNGSRILFGGLDDKERTEKILGQEHSTAYLNEASQITYGARNKAQTRLAQNVGLTPREYVDCNPPSKGHWVYKLFVRKVEPESGQPLYNPDDFSVLGMNPEDNQQNLPEQFLAQLDQLPERDRKRFLQGVFGEEVDEPLWTEESLARCRIYKMPQLQRVIIAVDPSGCAGPEDYRSDEVGISVCGTDGRRGYVLEDASGRYSPNAWARVVLDRMDEYGADAIVAERNFGGELVRSNIQGHDSNARVRLVTASRGKHIRAEPIAGLYEQGKVKHFGRFPNLEEQLIQFSTHGYTGDKSPDRADAMIHGLTDLAIANAKRKARVVR